MEGILIPETEALRLRKLLCHIFELPPLLMKKIEEVIFPEEKVSIENEISKKIIDAYENKREIKFLSSEIDSRMENIINESYDFLDNVANFKEQDEQEIRMLCLYQMEKQEFSILLLDWIHKAQFFELKSKNL